MIENQALASLAPYIAWNNAFTPTELEAIIAIGDRLALEEAGFGIDTAYNSDILITRMAGFRRTPETETIYRKVEMLVRGINDSVYQFGLIGFSEPFQYTVYKGDQGGHYDGHVDQGLLQVNRKLSFSLQLSDPDAYEVCNLELLTCNEIAAAPRARGTPIPFRPMPCIG